MTISLINLAFKLSLGLFDVMKFNINNLFLKVIGFYLNFFFFLNIIY
jgi:hypothetical protein